MIAEVKRALIKAVQLVMDKGIEKVRPALTNAKHAKDTDSIWRILSSIIERSVTRGLELTKNESNNYMGHGKPKYTSTTTMGDRPNEDDGQLTLECSNAKKHYKQAMRCRQIAGRLRRIQFGPKVRI